MTDTPRSSQWFSKSEVLYVQIFKSQRDERRSIESVVREDEVRKHRIQSLSTHGAFKSPIGAP